jgi:hypothetical protein
MSVGLSGGYFLAVSVAGGGSLNSVPAGIAYTNGGGIQGAVFEIGTMVTLTPSASTGYDFSAWSGACTGAGSCVVTMNGDINVSAAFIPQTFTVTAVMGVNGSVTPSNSLVNYGDSLMITITPNSGYTLSTLTDNGAPVTAVPGPSGTFTYTIANIASNHDTSATYTPLAESAVPVPALGLPGLLILTGVLSLFGLRRKQNR